MQTVWHKLSMAEGDIKLVNRLCCRQYVRKTPAPTVGQKLTGGVCKGGPKQRPCRGGALIDNILDWEHDLPDKDLDLAYTHSW